MMMDRDHVDFSISDVRICPMDISDLDEVMNIEESVFDIPWQRRGFETELLQNSFARYFVAYANEHLLGYAGIWIVLDESHLTTLAVCRPYQHRGVASLLLKHLISGAVGEGAIRMSLEVRPSNMSARLLYTRFGFVPRRLRKRYYHDEDAIIMVNEQIADQARP